MSRYIYLLPVLLVFFAAGATAQVGEPHSVTLSTKVTLIDGLSGEQVAVYRDSENNLLYIDFEQLHVNLKDVVLKNAEGVVVLRDQVFNLPVDTIYELKCSDYPPGLYSLELYSFASVIRRSLRLE